MKNTAKAYEATDELTSNERTMVSWLGDPYGPINKPIEVLFSDLKLNLLDSREIFKTLYDKLRKKDAFPMRDVVFSRLSQLTL